MVFCDSVLLFCMFSLLSLSNVLLLVGVVMVVSFRFDGEFMLLLVDIDWSDVVVFYVVFFLLLMFLEMFDGFLFSMFWLFLLLLFLFIMFNYGWLIWDF